jgi:hypothetical protein
MYVPLDGVAFICTHILYAEAPVLFVGLDFNGEWQFTCGDANHSGYNVKMMHLSHVRARFPDVEVVVAKLSAKKLGVIARRASKTDTWVYGKFRRDKSAATI